MPDTAYEALEGGAMLYLFDDYTLDTQLYELRCAGVLCPLEPQVFAVLHYLLVHRDRVVTRQELLEHVWSERFISEGTLDHRVMEARQAIGDSGQTQRRIQTLRSRGYRFVGAVEEQPLAGQRAVPDALQLRAPEISSRHVPASSRHPALVVGRNAELAQLHQWYAAACQGRRQIVCITGEVGIGKTTLVDAFMTQVATSAGPWIGRGQCIEHHGPGEAYLPLLEALGQLGQPPLGGELMALLQQYAPSWLLHLPRLVPMQERDAVQRRASGATKERMLRELAEAVEALATVRPLVLVLEDLHWSDDATLDWLVYVARRREAARLLVLGTYRPVEAVVQAHPVRRVSQELQVHDQCAEVRLAYMSVAAVTAYLVQRFTDARLPAGLAQVLHRRTNGNPLFLVTMVEALVQQGVLRAGATGWELVGELTTVAASLPETLRQLLERHVEQLATEEQTLLEAASVAGVEFAVAAVAAAVGWSVADVEERCATLARRGQFLRVCGMDAWPDGTVASRYEFLHTLYRETLYERVPMGRRVRWHQQIGQRLEAGYEPQARARAAELAEHFVRGRDLVRAVKYLSYAGEQAVQRSAPHEALRHLTQALELLAMLPETPARAQLELDILLTVGPVFIATKGYAASEVEQTYARARVLCMQVGDTPQLFPALRGLCAFYLTRGALLTARELGEQLDLMVQRAVVSTPRLESHDTLGGILFYLGEYAAAQKHLVQVIAHTDLATQRALALRQGAAPGVRCLTIAALTLWCLGYPAQAVQRSQEALALAQELAHPPSLVLAQLFAAVLQHRRRDVLQVQTHAEALVTLATAQQFPLWAGWGACWLGWALAIQGESEAGIMQMRQGLAAILATGHLLSQPFCLVLLAEAAGHAGQVAEGLHLVAEALAGFEASGRGDMLAEAHRIQGELLLRHAPSDTVRAEACFQQALAIAHCQQARSWELRAAVSLSRLWQRQGKHHAAQSLLAPIYGWFTEGLDTADVQEARTLLDALAGNG